MSEPEAYDAEHFRKFTPREGGILEELEKEAVEKDIPIVGPYVGKILWTIVKATNAKRVLELGTATGYSAIWMAKALSDTGGELISIEWDKDMAERARKNIARSGVSCGVKVVTGDARDQLSGLKSGHFDMVFQDVDKEMYLELLKPCVRVLRPGGLLICDNTSFRSAGEFLERSIGHPELEGFHILAFLPEHSPEHDALTFLVKK
jgi:predicted O-methyltransferase YrrM